MNKYKNAMSKIKISDEFKDVIIEKMYEKQEQLDKMSDKKYKNTGKITKIITTIIGIISVLLSGGLAYAGITKNLRFEGSGIEISQDAEKYEKIENQKLESDGNIIKLESTICDDGFVVLKFDITLSDESSIIAENGDGLRYVSFNDEITYEYGSENTFYSGANYNLIIDGKEYWLRGAVDQQIIENIKNKNYIYYQLYFLTENELQNKEEFTLTLDNVRLCVTDTLINFDGKFDINVSKEKAMNDTTTYNVNNAQISYDRLNANVEKIIETPMQTLIKLKRTINDANLKNFEHEDNDEYIGDIRYEVYNQDGKDVSAYIGKPKYTFYYDDGTKKEVDNDEGLAYDGFFKYDIEEYIVVPKDDMTDIRIELYEKNYYKGITRNIGEFDINFGSKSLTAKSKNKITEIDEDAPINYKNSYYEISISDIDEFSIKLDDSYKIEKEYLNVYSNETLYAKAEDEKVVEYSISSDDTGIYFSIDVFRDKSLYKYFDTYTSGELNYTPKKIKENDKYILVVNAYSEYIEKLIQNTIDTIEWK